MTSARRQEFVVFMSPGSFFDETSSKPIALFGRLGDIDARDVTKALDMSKDIVERYGAVPYGFCFETRIVADPVSDGEGGELTVPSKTVASSGTYFLGGEVKTYEEIQAEKPNSVLARNMRNPGWEIVWTRPGYGTRVFGPSDFVVSVETGEVIERGDAPHHVAARERIREAIRKDLEAKFR